MDEESFFFAKHMEISKNQNCIHFQNCRKEKIQCIIQYYKYFSRLREEFLKSVCIILRCLQAVAKYYVLRIIKAVIQLQHRKCHSIIILFHISMLRFKICNYFFFKYLPACCRYMYIIISSEGHYTVI